MARLDTYWLSSLDHAQHPGVTQPDAHPSLEERINAYFDQRGPYVIRATLTSDDGQSTISAFALSTHPDTAQQIGRALGRPYVLLVFDDGRVLAIGLGGEGRLQLGSIKDLVLRAHTHQPTSTPLRNLCRYYLGCP